MKNFKSFSLKSLSVILAIFVTLLSLPLTAVAVSFEQTPPSSEESSVTKKEIIELKDMRDANTKYFRLEDGTYYAARYDSAVHFLDENGEHIIQRYDRVVDLIDSNKVKRGKILSADSVLMDAKEVWEKGYNKLVEAPFYFVDYPKKED